MSSDTPSPTPLLHGVIAALLTPMRDAGTRVDVDAATRLVSWLVDGGIHGLYVAGTTGEGLYLRPEEHREISRAVVKAARGVPVVVHVGALTTAAAVVLARQGVQVEATAVAAPPPPPAPSLAAAVPVSMVSDSSRPGSRKWTWRTICGD